MERPPKSDMLIRLIQLRSYYFRQRNLETTKWIINYQKKKTTKNHTYIIILMCYSLMKSQHSTVHVRIEIGKILKHFANKFYQFLIERSHKIRLVSVHINWSVLKQPKSEIHYEYDLSNASFHMRFHKLFSQHSIMYC